MTITTDRAVDALTGIEVAGLPVPGDVDFDLVVGTTVRVRVRVSGDEVLVAEPDGDPDFAFTVGDEDWGRFVAEPPPRGYTSAQAIRATLGWGSVTGAAHRWAQYAPLVDRLFERLRAVEAPRPPRNPDLPPTATSPVRGRYLETGGRRIYCEEAGDGPVTVLCLHTAGADSRQFRHLLEDAELGRRFRFVAFDLPWHGRSDPPTTWQEETYRLTTADYADVIRGVSRELGLDRPVLLGCSMGGAIALYMSAVHGDEFRACLALEGGLGNPSRFVEWTNHLEVDHSVFLTSWVGGLIAPSSPAAARAQTLWGYAQSGPGVYQGDTYFYSEDFPPIAAGLGRATCPLWVFNGEYDYSATAEMSKEAADKLGGTYVDMPRCGHFPMSEDPAAFREYLVPVLEQIEAGGSDG